jgi:hypothetical protein
LGFFPGLSDGNILPNLTVREAPCLNRRLTLIEISLIKYKKLGMSKTKTPASLQKFLGKALLSTKRNASYVAQGRRLFAVEFLGCSLESQEFAVL